MDFTIITLGDLKAFETALNAIAMIFNPSNTTAFVTDGGLGFGGFIGVALMLALTVALFRGVINLKFELGELIVVAILYAALFVPKFDVILYDYYSDEVAAVDNVPLGIALPGAFISGITVEISEVLGQAFQTANPSVFGIKDQGFVYPLRILNALRNGSTNFKQQSPALSTSIGRLYVDCAYGRDGFNHEDVMNSEFAFERLLNYTTNSTGITEYYDNENPTGVGLTCQEATDRIRSSVDDYFNASASTQYAGSSAKNPEGVSQFAGLLCGNMRVVKKSTGGCPTFDDYSTALSALGVASGTRALDFAKTTLITGTIKEAAYCASAGPTSAQLAECIPFVTALEQYKEDAVAAGSLFQRTMLNSMSLMLFLFYCFAPIVSILMVVMGAKGIKLLGSYFLFGVWTQSWLPFATILHFYIQIKVNDDLSRFGDVGGLITPAKYPEFYSSVSTNLALASDLLAATPILTLALLSGSIFALTGVATRMSGRDYYNEKTNAPDMVSNSAAVTNLSSMQGNMGLGMTQQGLSKPSELQFSRVSTSAQQQVEQAQAAVSQQQSRAIVTSLRNSLSRVDNVDSLQSFGNGLGVSIDKSDASSITKAYQSAYTQSMSQTQSSDMTDEARITRAQQAGYQAAANSQGLANLVKNAGKQGGAAGKGAAILKTVLGSLGVSVGANDTTTDAAVNSMKEQIGTTAGSGQGTTDSDAVGKTGATSVADKKSRTIDRVDSFLRGIRSIDGKEYSDSDNATFTELSQRTSTYQQSQTNANSSQETKTVDAAQFYAAASRNPELTSELLANHQRLANSNPAYLQALAKAQDRINSTEAATATYLDANGERVGGNLPNGALYAMATAQNSIGDEGFKSFVDKHFFDRPNVPSVAENPQLRGMVEDTPTVTPRITTEEEAELRARGNYNFDAQEKIQARVAAETAQPVNRDLSGLRQEGEAAVEQKFGADSAKQEQSAANYGIMLASASRVLAGEDGQTISRDIKGRTENGKNLEEFSRATQEYRALVADNVSPEDPRMVRAIQQVQETGSVFANGVQESLVGSTNPGTPAQLRPFSSSAEIQSANNLLKATSDITGQPVTLYEPDPESGAAIARLYQSVMGNPVSVDTTEYQPNSPAPNPGPGVEYTPPIPQRSSPPPVPESSQTNSTASPPAQNNAPSPQARQRGTGVRKPGPAGNEIPRAPDQGDKS